MANIVFSNNKGIFLGTFPFLHKSDAFSSTLVSITTDAAGEYYCAIGKVRTENGLSKTISSAGGAVYWRSGTITFANAGTTLRVGIQDLTATGFPDGTFDVSADLVGGTDAIAANAFIATNMESGSKTVSDGQIVAIMVEMISRGGTDSVQVSRTSTASSFPYVVANTGSPTKVSAEPLVSLLFDDGTVGWLDTSFCYTTAGSFYGSASNPDEKALIFTLPFSGVLDSVTWYGSLNGSSSDFEIILYSSPTTSPAVIQAMSFDADLFSTTSQVYHSTPITPKITLDKDVEYGLAFRPTTSNAIALIEYQFPTSAARRATPLGTNWYLGGRQNQTGNFSPTTTSIPAVGMFISEIQSSGGGTNVFS